MRQRTGGARLRGGGCRLLTASHRIHLAAGADFGAPVDTGEFIAAVHRLAALIRGGTSIAAHCRQSVGRSGLLAASVAVACGMPLQTALETISKARGVAVPETAVQKQWLQRIEGRLSSSDRRGC